MRLTDPDTLEIITTIYDNTVWTKPWVTKRDYHRIQKGVKASWLPPGVTMSSEPQEWMCTLAITNFDPKTNSYTDKSPEDMVKLLDQEQQ